MIKNEQKPKCGLSTFIKIIVKKTNCLVFFENHLKMTYLRFPAAFDL